MAKPYKEGAGWAFRLRKAGQDIYRTGFSSEAAARKAMTAISVELEQGDQPALQGPYKTPVGVALSDYALEVLPFRKGAAQEARRINRFLRAVGLPVIKLARVTEPCGPAKAAMRTQERGEQSVHFKVTLVEERERRIPNSLREHRARLRAESIDSEALRISLARTAMADVSSHQLQALVGKLEAEGCGMSTVRLEVAILRQLFNHARRIWRWPRPLHNPASGLRVMRQDNARKRILSEEEWAKMAPVLARSGNKFVFPLVCLMLESATRSCEPLMLLRWGHVSWERRVLELPDGKTGKRDVPLGPGAVAILQYVRTLVPEAGADAPVFPTTYEAVRKVWSEARKEAGVVNIQLHDLRHTAATRYAFEFNGNVMLLKVVTGHKTLAMVDRYVNATAEHVAALMHGESLSPQLAPAGHHSDVMDVVGEAMEQAAAAKALVRARVAKGQSRRRAEQEARKRGIAMEPAAPMHMTPAPAAPEPTNVIRVDFARKAA